MQFCFCIYNFFFEFVVIIVPHIYPYRIIRHVVHFKRIIYLFFCFYQLAFFIGGYFFFTMQLLIFFFAVVYTIILSSFFVISGCFFYVFYLLTGKQSLIPAIRVQGCIIHGEPWSIRASFLYIFCFFVVYGISYNLFSYLYVFLMSVQNPFYYFIILFTILVPLSVGLTASQECPVAYLYGCNLCENLVFIFILQFINLLLVAAIHHIIYIAGKLYVGFFWVHAFRTGPQLFVFILNVLFPLIQSILWWNMLRKISTIFCVTENGFIRPRIFKHMFIALVQFYILYYVGCCPIPLWGLGVCINIGLQLITHIYCFLHVVYRDALRICYIGVFCVCTSACTCICTSACTGACTGAYIGICIGACIGVCTGACIGVCTTACIGVCTSIRTLCMQITIKHKMFSYKAIDRCFTFLAFLCLGFAAIRYTYNCIYYRFRGNIITFLFQSINYRYYLTAKSFGRVGGFCIRGHPFLQSFADVSNTTTHYTTSNILLPQICTGAKGHPAIIFVLFVWVRPLLQLFMRFFGYFRTGILQYVFAKLINIIFC
ncbi:pB602L [African swine fever virus]|uniref:PB602L n=1 Tax=African swine fever virus TaxID=10497 RepID=A0A894KSJ9_ASF|nr:pB602L [African swine fever virus]